MALNPFIGNVSSLAEANALNTASYFGGATLVIFDDTSAQPANCGITAATQMSVTSPPNYNSNVCNILAVFTLPVAGSNTIVNYTTTTGGATLTFGAITNVTANRSGNARWFRVLNGATVSGPSNQITVKGNEIMDGSIGTATSDLILNSIAISSGATVSISSFVITFPD